MADIFTKEKRSEVMSKIKSKDTKPEMIVRRMLFSEGFRYRIHVGSLPGKPDIVLKKYNTVVFVHGCFWHGHSCSIGSGKRKPKSNKSYWNEKLAKNKTRFEKYRRELRKMGWQVIVVWECEAKNPDKLKKKLKPLLESK